MTTLTPVFGFPSPTSTEAADGPLAFHNLALAVENALLGKKSIIATEEARSSTAYGRLASPDLVTGMVLPADGLFVVAYQAMFKESVNAAAKAAIFLNTNQLVIPQDAAASPVAQETGVDGIGIDSYSCLATWMGGLASSSTGPAYTGHATTGQVVGASGMGQSVEAGVCYIFAAAGTYDISIQFKASSGTVTAKQRKLWVRTLRFT